MPPKSALITEDGESGAKRPLSYFPLTTQGKIALSEWRKANPKNVPRAKPEKKYSDRPCSLPPPGELTEIDRILQLRKTVPTTRSSRNSRRNDPLTTQQKIQAAEAMKRARGNKGDEEDPNPVRKVLMPGLVRQARAMEARGMEYDSTKEQTVLYRKTRRNTAWARRNHVNVGSAPCANGFTILNLPEDIRHRIWYFAVVEADYFIWPESPTGQEQPDLAMTCRQIRRETLPIFYRFNTFGVVISPEDRRPVAGDGRNGPLSPLHGIAAVRAWGETLEDEELERGKWFRMIRHWAFELPERTESARFVVIVRFPQRGVHDAPLPPEIHRQAACVLPCGKADGPCSPGVLSANAMIYIREEQEFAWVTAGVQVDRIVLLAEQLREMRDDLEAAKCIP